MRLVAVLLLCAWWFPCQAGRTLPAAGTVEVAFTPWDDAEGALIREIRGARHAIRVQAFLITSRTITRALIDAHHRGIDVQVLADREMAEKGEKSLIPDLHAAGIPVWLEVRYNAAHNKIVLVDPQAANPCVITGSYNFTFSAQARNAENLLILRGNAPLARAYLDNWRRHRQEAVSYAEHLK